MLIYAKDGGFKEHRDQQHGPGHFATLVIVLPVQQEKAKQKAERRYQRLDETGDGDLILRCQHDEDTTVGIQSHSPPTRKEAASWHVFALGTSHQITKVRSEYRVALSFTLWIEGGIAADLLRVPRLPKLLLLGKSIQHWIPTMALKNLSSFVCL